MKNIEEERQLIKDLRQWLKGQIFVSYGVDAETFTIYSQKKEATA